MFGSSRYVKHFLLLYAPFFARGDSVLVPLMSYPSHVGAVESSELAFDNYNDPSAANHGSKSSKTKSSKPKSSKNHAPTKTKRELTAKPTEPPTSSPTQFPTLSIMPTQLPTLAPTYNSSLCPEYWNVYRTCFDGAFVSTPPVFTEDQMLSNGTMYVSSVINYTDSNFTCADQRELEELTVLWLKDNVGSPESFTPACAFNVGMTDLDISNSETSVLGVAFKMQVFFVTDKEWLEEDEHTHFEPVSDRRLNCHNGGIAQSCNAVNRGNSNAASCRGCRRLSSSPENFESGFTPHLRSLQTEGNRTGTIFNDQWGEYVGFDTKLTGALLDDDAELDATNIAVCGTLYYSAVVMKENMICKYFNALNCRKNGFIDYDSLGNDFCCDETAKTCEDALELSFVEAHFTTFN